MIKAICFDLDGVYFTPAGKKGFQGSLIKLGIPEEKVTYILGKSPEMREFMMGKLNEEEFWGFVARYFGVRLTVDEFISLMIQNYEINAEVRAVVLNLRARGYKTCVCSNNSVSRIRGLQQKFNFLEDFDVVVLSYEVGRLKPDKELFEELARRANLPADEIVYSDDNPDRIQGASELGIKTFVYEDFEQFLNKLRELGVAI